MTTLIRGKAQKILVYNMDIEKSILYVRKSRKKSCFQKNVLYGQTDISNYRVAWLLKRNISSNKRK